MSVNCHKFKFSLPLTGGDAVLEMDGKQLHGVVSLDIRTSRDEITTVLLEMDASAAVEMSAMLGLTLVGTDSLTGELGTILAEALTEAGVDNYKGRIPAGCPLDVAACRYLELLIENSGKEEKED